MPRSPVRRSVPAPPLLCAVLVAALAGVRGAEAHPVPFSYLDFRLKAGVLEGSVTLHVFDLAHDLDIQPAERLLDPAFAAERATAVHDLLAGRFGISADGRELEPQWSSPELLAGRNSLRLPVRYALAGRPGTLRIHAAMFPYDPQHQTFLNIYEDEALTQAMLEWRPPRIRVLLRHAAGRRRRGAEVRARRRPPHPDRPGPPAVPRRPAAARRVGPPAGRGRHRVHGGPQHHAVARRAESRQPARAYHRAGHRAEHRVRRRRQPAREGWT